MCKYNLSVSQLYRKLRFRHNGLVQNLDSGLWTLDWTVDWTLDCILDCILDWILDLTSYAWPRRHVRGRYISVSVDAYGNLSGDDVE